MTVIKSTEIETRDQFGYLCDARGVRVALEVGVDMGEFADRFLDRWGGERLVLVDPYRAYPEMPWDRPGDMAVMLQRLTARHYGRFRHLPTDSLGAAEYVTTLAPWLRPGFVYLDAAHDYDSVRVDIDAWWDVLPADGILAGHDHDPTHPGVVRAVKEFARRTGATVYLTARDDLPSWYAYKTWPGPDAFPARLPKEKP